MNYYNQNSIDIRKLYLKIGKRLSLKLGKYVKDDSMGEDLMHDTFVKVIEHIETYKPQCKIETWIYRIGINLAINHLRTRTRKKTESYDALENPENFLPQTKFPSPEEELIFSELVEIAEKGFERLPKEMREPFYLSFGKKCTYEEISEILNIPQGTVKSRLSRGRGQFLSRLENSLNS